MSGSRKEAIPWVPILLARELRDGERVHLGAGQAVAQLAVGLATEVHGVRLHVSVAGARLLSPTSRPAVYVGALAFDEPVVRTADYVFAQARYFDKVDNLPLVMGSGFQVDARGNLNLVGVSGPDGWRAKGPGMAGLPSLTGFARRLLLYLNLHDRRRLVEDVEFVSIVGDPQARAGCGLSPATQDGRVITPLAVFRWDTEGFLAVSRMTPDVSWVELAERTGFLLRRHPEFAVAPSPSAAEISVYERITRMRQEEA